MYIDDNIDETLKEAFDCLAYASIKKVLLHKQVYGNFSMKKFNNEHLVKEINKVIEQGIN